MPATKKSTAKKPPAKKPVVKAVSVKKTSVTKATKATKPATKPAVVTKATTATVATTASNAASVTKVAVTPTPADAPVSGQAFGGKSVVIPASETQPESAGAEARNQELKVLCKTCRSPIPSDSSLAPDFGGKKTLTAKCRRCDATHDYTEADLVDLTSWRVKR